jgi:hypothetical protein
MPSNAGSVGVDYSITYFDGTTQRLVDLGDIQNVKFTAMKHDISNRPFNAPPKFDYIPDGHRVSFTITRTTQGLENIAVQRESNFNQGIGTTAGYLNKSVVNQDLTTSRYQYQGFVFFLTDLGDVSREKIVTLSGEGMASQLIQIA